MNKNKNTIKILFQHTQDTLLEYKNIDGMEKQHPHPPILHSPTRIQHTYIYYSPHHRSVTYHSQKINGSIAKNSTHVEPYSQYEVAVSIVAHSAASAPTTRISEDLVHPPPAVPAAAAAAVGAAGVVPVEGATGVDDNGDPAREEDAEVPPAPPPLPLLLLLLEDPPWCSCAEVSGVAAAAAAWLPVIVGGMMALSPPPPPPPEPASSPPAFLLLLLWLAEARGGRGEGVVLVAAKAAVACLATEEITPLDARHSRSPT